MTHHTEPDNGYSKQEQDDFEIWLSEQEKQTVANLETHMNLMFEQIFGGRHE